MSTPVLMGVIRRSSMGTVKAGKPLVKKITIFCCNRRRMDEDDIVLGGTAGSLINRSVARHFF
jgi:hypothetical protein